MTQYLALTFVNLIGNDLMRSQCIAFVCQIAGDKKGDFMHLTRANKLTCHLQAITQASRQVVVESIQDRIAALVKKQIGIDIQLDAPLMEAGLDSLGAIELRASISSTFETELPATAIFDHPTIAALSALIAGLSQPTPQANAQVLIPEAT